MGWIDTAVVAQFHSVRYRPQTAAWSLDVLRKTNIDHLYRYISCQQRKYVYVSIYHKTSNRSYARYAARVPERRNTHDQTNIPAGGYSSKTPVTNLLGTRYEFESVQAVRTTVHHTQKLISLSGNPPPFYRRRCPTSRQSPSIWLYAHIMCDETYSWSVQNHGQVSNYYDSFSRGTRLNHANFSNRSAPLRVLSRPFIGLGKHHQPTIRGPGSTPSWTSHQRNS